MSPTPPLRRPAIVTALLLLGLLLACLVPTACAEENDDLEFARRLARSRLSRYAREMYRAILEDASRTDDERAEARYGLALVTKEVALAMAGDAKAPYDVIVRLFKRAVADIEAYVEQGPDGSRVGPARLDAGTIRLAFVQWAGELLDDPCEVAERGFDMGKLSDDAHGMVEEAIVCFDALRPADGGSTTKPHEELAAYYATVSRYHRALLQPPCSPSQLEGLAEAATALETYICGHDGQVLAVYAQDVYGLVWWEMAQCEEDPEKKFDACAKAFEWFETCLFAADEGPDMLRVITRGYHHVAEVGAEAGHLHVSAEKDRDFASDAAAHLETMLVRHPEAWRTESGLRALITWSELECKRGNLGGALEIIRDAAERARRSKRGTLERLAGRRLADYVSSDCGGPSADLVDPGLFRLVAEDRFLAGEYRQAICGYRRVIAATPDTTQAFLDYRWNAWRRMAQSYKQLGDRLGEALAYEPIHEAWVQGRIPHEKGSRDDVNLLRAGYERRYAEGAVKVLAEQTGAAVFRSLHRSMRDGFILDYPQPHVHGSWNIAIDMWKLGTRRKRDNDGPWRRTLEGALEHFVNISNNPKATYQDLAWVYRVRIPFECGTYAGAINTAEEASNFWNSPEARAREEEFPTIRQRRMEAKAALVVWQARSLRQLERHAEAIALLADYHTTYPNATGTYASLAYDDLIRSHVAVGSIAEAERCYRRLLAHDPTYFALHRITFLLASHHDARREAIESKLRETTRYLGQTRRELRAVSKEVERLEALVSDLLAQWHKSREPHRGLRPLDAKVIKDLERTVRVLERKIPALEDSLARVQASAAELRGQLGPLQAEKRRLELQLYESLAKPATYYYLWARTLASADVKPDPVRVFELARMVWRAAKLRPERLGDWRRAQELFEQVLAFPSVGRLPRAHPMVHEALVTLGVTCAHLAARETDAAARGILVTRAIEVLEDALPQQPVHRDLVLGLIADEILVLSYRMSGGTRWRMPLPRPDTLRLLREAAANLAVERLFHVPDGEDVGTSLRPSRALALFQRELRTLDDTTLEHVMPRPGRSLFDPILFRLLAHAEPELRLALAWCYADTGREPDLPKALNLARSLVGGPLAVEEDTAMWWHARDIQLDALLDGAEHFAEDETRHAEAEAWLERARKVHEGVRALFPDLGEDVIEGHRARWEALGKRIEGATR